MQKHMKPSNSTDAHFMDEDMAQRGPNGLSTQALMLVFAPNHHMALYPPQSRPVSEDKEKIHRSHSSGERRGLDELVKIFHVF